ncbi:MAG: flagellar motor protein MotB [Sporolactobacillus sp.]
MANHRKRHPVKKVESHENSDRWMVTYSDLITLLLVFFIVMFSMSSVQNEKFNSLISTLKQQFNGSSILESMGYPATEQGQADSKSIVTLKKSHTSSKKQSSDDVDTRRLDSLYTQINKYIEDNHLSPEVTLEETPRGVQLTFREQILFDLGKADLKPEALPILQKIGGLINQVNNEVSVEGFTDNTPYSSHNSPFQNNWELSGARAQTVMNYLIDNDHLQPNRFHFVGYGEYRPVVPNDTPEHKAMNRRVNIVIIRAGEDESSN